MRTKTTTEAWEHNEPVRWRHYSFDVCWSPVIGLVLTGHTVCLCSHFPLHYIQWLINRFIKCKACTLCIHGAVFYTVLFI